MQSRKRVGKIQEGIGRNRRRTVPAVREADVLAIFLADIHLSLKPPIWRSAEPDWLAAQAKSLEEVQLLQEKYECPVICAGDIFDRSRKIADGWNASPELINFAINYLPNNMYAIPGQHDLPNHQYSDIHRSAYWTLFEAGKIKNIPPNGITIVGERLALFGFPPGYEIEPPRQNHAIVKEGFVIAVVHDYVWIEGCSYPKAPDDKFLLNDKLHNKICNGKYFGYDMVVYGDNHKGFLKNSGSVKTTIFNCGTLMRRKSDEINYYPQVGLLMDDGSVVPHHLDISQDKYITKAEERVKDVLDMGDFFDELEKLGKTALDFEEAMKQFLQSGRTSTEAKEIIFKAMEK